MNATIPQLIVNSYPHKNKKKEIKTKWTFLTRKEESALIKKYFKMTWLTFRIQAIMHKKI